METILENDVADATEEQTETEVQTAEPEVIPDPVDEGDEVNNGELEEPEVPKYEPNHKFSFMDKEYEFDDRIKDLVKTKEDEDYFRDMVTAQKAHSAYKEFGGIRELGEKMKGYENVDGSYQELKKDVNYAQGMLHAGNIEQFREYLGIPKEKLLDWAIKEAQAQQDPSQAQALQQEYQQQIQQYNQQQENFNLQYKHDMMQNDIEAQMAKQKNVELDMGLEGSNVAKAYDNLVGTQGSFRQAVINHGLSEHQLQGRDVSIAEAIKAVEGQFEGLVANQSVGTQQNPQTQVQNQVSNPKQTVVINQGNQETIPNLRAGSATPAKKKFMSLADLKKHAATLDD